MESTGLHLQINFKAVLWPPVTSEKHFYRHCRKRKIRQKAITVTFITWCINGTWGKCLLFMHKVPFSSWQIINLLLSPHFYPLIAMKWGYSFVCRIKCSYFSKISCTGNETQSPSHTRHLHQQIQWEATSKAPSWAIRWAGNDSSSIE